MIRVKEGTTEVQKVECAPEVTDGKPGGQELVLYAPVLFSTAHRAWLTEELP